MILPLRCLGCEIWIGRCQTRTWKHIIDGVAGVTLDLLAMLCSRLEQCLPSCADPEHGFEQSGAIHYRLAQSAGVGTFFERDPDALPTLVQILLPASI